MTRPYAIAEAGPFKGEPGGTVKDIRIVLKRGFQGRIRAVDPQGHPIGNANFSGYFNYHSWTSGQAYRWREDNPLRTDARGMAVIDDASSLTVTLWGVASGYEEERWTSIQLAPDTTTTLTMKPSIPTKGVIVAAGTGAPIEGAKLHLIKLSPKGA